MKSADFLPTTSLDHLKFRSDALHHLRTFFRSHEYMEVETPLLSHETIVDAHLNSFVTSMNDSSSDVLYLQTSPEAGMKRLLAAGSESIYQITRSFRKGEIGDLHNPEFTIAEWYRIGDTPDDQMIFIEEMVHHLVKECVSKPNSNLSNAFEKVSYDEVFKIHFGITFLDQKTETIINHAKKRGLNFPESLQNIPEEDWDRDDLLNLILSEFIEPNLGLTAPTFVYDYPPSQAALSRIREKPTPVAERFELYIQGVEICNGYHELTDADELARRTAEENRKRTEHGLSQLPAPERLLNSMRAGIPDCTGVALGLDRLLMLLCDESSIKNVIAFPFPRA